MGTTVETHYVAEPIEKLYHHPRRRVTAMKERLSLRPLQACSSLAALLLASTANTSVAQPTSASARSMSRDELSLILLQASLTVCELSKQKMDYKQALTTSAIPAFQLIKFRHKKKIEGMATVPKDEDLIRYLGIKISELAANNCRDHIPSSVSSEIRKIKNQR